MVEYESIRRKIYDGGATFIPVCDKCGSFVKADKEILINGMGELSKEPNATCKKDGRTHMIFEGFI